MPELRSSSLMYAIALLIALASLPAVAADQPKTCQLQVRWADDKPYTWQDEHGEIQGLYADLARALLSRLNCQPEFVKLPWARSLAELEAGRLDLLFGAYSDEQRARFAHFSAPINRSPNRLFMSLQAFKKYPGDQLATLIGTGFRLGVQIGVNYNGQFEALRSDTDFAALLVPINSRQNGWKMLVAGRLDGMLADEDTALTELRDMGLLDQVRASNVVVSEKPAKVAFSRKSVDGTLVSRFDRALSDMMADGAYRAIMQRHLPCPLTTDQLGCDWSLESAATE